MNKFDAVVFIGTALGKSGDVVLVEGCRYQIVCVHDGCWVARCV